MFTQDPFSGHVVTRTTDRETPGSDYKLWTTLKVPRPFDMDAHCRYLMEQTGATAYKLLPARKLFALGVGHVRRRTIEPGDKTDAPLTASPSRLKFRSSGNSLASRSRRACANSGISSRRRATVFSSRPSTWAPPTVPTPSWAATAWSS